MDYISELLKQDSDIVGRILDDNMEDEVLNIDTNNINIRKIQHKLNNELFYEDIKNSKLNAYITNKYPNYPDVFDFADSNPDPSLVSSMVSSMLSTVFKVKYNQIEKVLYEQYDKVLELPESDAEEFNYQYIDDFSLLTDSDPFNTFLSTYNTDASLYDLLLQLDRIYTNGKDAILVKYLTSLPDTKSEQISQEQIRSLINMVRNINKDLVETSDIIINRVMIISFNKISPAASNSINNMSYLTENISDRIVEFRIKYELFYHNQLMYNVMKSTFVPWHTKLTDNEIGDLFRKTGWNRDSLQGMSHVDPVAVYQGFKIGDVIRIYRKSHTTTEISRYSVAYRVVRPIPLTLATSDESKSNKFVDILTE